MTTARELLEKARWFPSKTATGLGAGAPTGAAGDTALATNGFLSALLPPDLGYVHAYWSSPAHDFVPFLIGVKNKYDPCDLFKFAQSIPLAC